MTDKELLKYVRECREYLMKKAPYGSASEYEKIRDTLMDNVNKDLIPNFMRLYRTNEDLYNFFNSKILTTKDRVKCIADGFETLIVKLEDSVFNGNKRNDLCKLNIVDLPSKLLIAMNENQLIYPIIFYTENFIRLFVSIKYYEIFKDYSLQEFLKNCSKAQETYNRNKQDEEKYSWLKERGSVTAFYLDFNDLKNIIISNWDIFKTDFPDQAFVTHNFNEFYKIRCKVAHNSYTISEDEKDIIKKDAYIMVNQLKKYSNDIRTFKL